VSDGIEPFDAVIAVENSALAAPPVRETAEEAEPALA
jgi:hypothetical protein